MLELPYPPTILRPNNPSHWRAKAKAKSLYRAQCHLRAKDNIPKLPQGYIHLHIVFHPPTLRAFDLDNALAQIKSGIDGIADAWGVNDKMFRPYTIDFGEKRDGGMVVVSVFNGER